MFYEEAIIGDVLCWRSTPYGEWVPFTASQLTAKLVQLRCELATQREVIDDLEDSDRYPYHELP